MLIVTGAMTSTPDLSELARARELAATGTGRLIREWAQLSIREVAASINAAPSAVFRWETGQRVPRSDKGLRWARAMWELHEKRRKP